MNCTVTVKDIYGTNFVFAPIGYETTDTFVIPRPGDTFLSPKYEVCTLEDGDVTPKGPRVILKKLPAKPKFKVGDRVVTVSATTQDAGVGVVEAVMSGPRYVVRYSSWYGECHEPEAKITFAPSIPTQPAKAPEGYYFTGEYRKPKEGEWILDNGGQAWRCRMDFENDSHFILKPLPLKPTRWLIEVESEVKPGNGKFGKMPDGLDFYDYSSGEMFKALSVTPAK